MEYVPGAMTRAVYTAYQEGVNIRTVRYSAARTRKNSVEIESSCMSAVFSKSQHYTEPSGAPASMYEITALAALEPEQSGYWLNRISSSTVEIRRDVRLAASAIWRTAQQKTQSRINDSSDTAALMEVAAAKASDYLNNLGDEAAAANTKAVLMKIFCRVLTRYAGRLRRLQPFGDNIELEAEAPKWEDRLMLQLVFEKLERYLSADGVTILTRRRQGHEWNEIAHMLGLPVAVVRSRFWREINNARAALGIDRKRNVGAKRSPDRVQEGSSSEEKSIAGRSRL